MRGRQAQPLRRRRLPTRHDESLLAVQAEALSNVAHSYCLVTNIMQSA